MKIKYGTNLKEIQGGLLKRYFFAQVKKISFQFGNFFLVILNMFYDSTLRYSKCSRSTS